MRARRAVGRTGGVAGWEAAESYAEPTDANPSECNDSASLDTEAADFGGTGGSSFRSLTEAASVQQEPPQEPTQQEPSAAAVLAGLRRQCKVYEKQFMAQHQRMPRRADVPASIVKLYQQYEAVKAAIKARQ